MDDDNDLIGLILDDDEDNSDGQNNDDDYRQTWQKMAFLATAELITGAFVFLTPWVGIQSSPVTIFRYNHHYIVILGRIVILLDS